MLAVGTTAIMLGSAVFAGAAAAAQPTISPSQYTNSVAPTPGVQLTEVPANSTLQTGVQWVDCSDPSCSSPTPISGATNQQYTVAPSDVNSYIAVQEFDAGVLASTSQATLQVAPPPPPPPTNTTPPSISGTPQVGQGLTLTQGTWQNANSITDTWYSCSGASCNPVSTSTTGYTLKPSDAGNMIYVQETASDSGVPAANPVNSNQLGPVTLQPPAVVTPPVIIGSPAIGQTLTADHGSWSPQPSSYAYQWEQCDSSGGACVAIAGQTNPTYVVSPADLGHTLDVTVVATDSGGSSAPVAAQAAAGPVASVASSTSLLVLPAAPVTNQGVTLVASVSSSIAPTGTVAFQDGGTTIPGCSAVGVSSQGSATCQTSFSAAAPSHALTATFASNNPTLAGSTSQITNVTVGRDNTATQLDVPNTVVTANHSITFTASVTPAHPGSVQPTGTVQFQDNGQAISGCSSQALTQSQGIESAQCTVTYAKRGSHSITAVYGGDAAFNGSNSASPSAQSLTVIRLGPRVRGAIVTQMKWKFYYTPRWTRVLAMLVHRASVGTKIVLRCEGKGCPFTTRSMRVRRRHRSPNIARLLRGARLRVGTTLIVEFIRRDWIGKIYVFQFRSRRGPHYRIGCLKPGSNKFGKICR